MYEDRIVSIRSMLIEHNQAIGDGEFGAVNIDKFFKILKAAGGTTVERLAAMSHDDIIACLKPSITGDNIPEPRILAKAIADICRDKHASPDTKADIKYISSKKAGTMAPQALISLLNPDEFDNAVGKRLKQLSKGKRFIVYNDNGTINVNESTKLLIEVKDGFPERQTIDIDDEIKKVYAIGTKPPRYVDENPLYPNRPLRPDGSCDQTNRSWEGIALEVRQFIRIAIIKKELIISIDKAHDTIDTLLQPNGLTTLKHKYQQSAIVFEEDRKLGRLPHLLIEINNLPDEIIAKPASTSTEHSLQDYIQKACANAKRTIYKPQIDNDELPQSNWYYRPNSNSHMWCAQPCIPRLINRYTK